ncbi:MAG: FadR family transcriptional regulator, partial [Spirochaetales bacterium]|nr:FadR family transcriptional regulator [Spirochaetales bacterium]
MAITKIRLSEQVFQELKRMIEEKEFHPGDRFYSENQLTAMLGVSRSSIREAIRLLEVSGLVRVHQGKGIFIADRSQEGQSAFTQWLRDNEASLAEVFEMRIIIDSKAAGYAARNAEEAEIRTLEDICELFRTRAQDEIPA